MVLYKGASIKDHLLGLFGAVESEEDVAAVDVGLHVVGPHGDGLLVERVRLLQSRRISVGRGRVSSSVTGRGWEIDVTTLLRFTGVNGEKVSTLFHWYLTGDSWEFHRYFHLFY